MSQIRCALCLEEVLLLHPFADRSPYYSHANKDILCRRSQPGCFYNSKKLSTDDIAYGGDGGSIQIGSFIYTKFTIDIQRVPKSLRKLYKNCKHYKGYLCSIQHQCSGARTV
jgi:hypothetical protein